MISGCRCEGKRKASVRAQTGKNEYWAALFNFRTVLFKTNINTQITPPNFSRMIEFIFLFFVNTLFACIPPVKIFVHNGILSYLLHAILFSYVRDTRRFF